jgi:hypothetical protein
MMTTTEFVDIVSGREPMRMFVAAPKSAGQYPGGEAGGLRAQKLLDFRQRLFRRALLQRVVARQAFACDVHAFVFPH